MPPRPGRREAEGAEGAEAEAEAGPVPRPGMSLTPASVEKALLRRRNPSGR